MKHLIMSETTINQRLNFLVKELGMKPGAFSRALNLSETTVRNYIDRTAKPSSDVLEKIATTFKQVNLVWLITGEGEPFQSEKSGSGDYQHVEAKNFLGNVTGTNLGTMSQGAGSHATLPDCEKELEALKRENELLKQQLIMAQALIAAKEETITLLRGSYNRPN